MSPILHVVGAGLAGLSAALAGIRAGWKVMVHEAAPQAGGRCRSFRCERLDRVIDNGSHLILGANRNTLEFCAAIGGLETLIPAKPIIPFLDLASGRQWRLSPGKLTAGLGETALALGLPWISRHQSVAARLGRRSSFASLWEPLCLAALNTPAAEASAAQFSRLLRAVVLGGAKALRPYVAASGLSAALAAPAVATLAAHGTALRFRRRLVGLRHEALLFEDGPVMMMPGDRAILALPPWALAEFLPEQAALPSRAIVNAHFRLDEPLPLPGGQPFLGLVGGAAHWLFARDDVVSVTVSAADKLAAQPAEEVAALLWRDVAQVLALAPDSPPPARVIKERRATLAHTPEVVRRRPPPSTGLPWLWLAGDWLASPWPCTIEAAISSGLTATRLAVGQDDLSFAC